MTKLIDGYPVVDDNYSRPPGFESHGTGYTARDYQAFPLNGMSFCQQPSVKRLTEQEILEIAIEKTAKKTWIIDLCDRVGSIVKNQQSAEYCWIHAPVRGMECIRVAQGGPHPPLSAFYPAWLIKHGQNTGGSGIQGIHTLADHGTCMETMVPPMTFHVNVTPEITANGNLHKIEVYEEFDPDDTQLQMSSVCQDQPYSVGIPYWSPDGGHEVLATFLAFANTSGKPTFGDLREGIDNSWGIGWGKNGRGVLSGTKRKFDEAGRIAAISQSIA